MRARKKRGRTQEWLAGKLGCSAAHIGNVENGHCPLNPSRIDTADKELKADGTLVRQYRDLYQPETVDWLDEFHTLQLEAVFIREYHSTLVPAVLQQTDYAKSVINPVSPGLVLQP